MYTVGVQLAIIFPINQPISLSQRADGKDFSIQFTYKHIPFFLAFSLPASWVYQQARGPKHQLEDRPVCDFYRRCFESGVDKNTVCDEGVW